MNAQPLELPDHLRGRRLWKYDSTTRYIDGGKDWGRVGKPCSAVMDDLWPVLTPEQQHAVAMASIVLPYMLDPRRRWKEDDFGRDVRLWGDGDIQVLLTNKQIAALTAATAGNPGKENKF